MHVPYINAPPTYADRQTVAERTCVLDFSPLPSMLLLPPRTRLRAAFHPLRLVTANSFGRALLLIAHGAAPDELLLTSSLEAAPRVFSRARWTRRSGASR